MIQASQKYRSLIVVLRSLRSYKLEALSDIERFCLYSNTCNLLRIIGCIELGPPQNACEWFSWSQSVCMPLGELGMVSLFDLEYKYLRASMSNRPVLTAPTKYFIDEAQLESERNVVLEERRQRTDSSPRARFQEAFRAALLDLKQGDGRWQEYAAPISVAGGRLFSARIAFPDTVQTGDYRVEVLLVRERRIAARQALFLRVERVGTAASIANVARSQPLVYGVVCILLATIAGWLGSVLFRRG